MDSDFSFSDDSFADSLDEEELVALTARPVAEGARVESSEATPAAAVPAEPPATAAPLITTAQGEVAILRARLAALETSKNREILRLAEQNRALVANYESTTATLEAQTRQLADEKKVMEVQLGHDSKRRRVVEERVVVVKQLAQDDRVELGRVLQDAALPGSLVTCWEVFTAQGGAKAAAALTGALATLLLPEVVALWLSALTASLAAHASPWTAELARVTVAFRPGTVSVPRVADAVLALAQTAVSIVRTTTTTLRSPTGRLVQTGTLIACARLLECICSTELTSVTPIIASTIPQLLSVHNCMEVVQPAVRMAGGDLGLASAVARLLAVLLPPCPLGNPWGKCLDQTVQGDGLVEPPHIAAVSMLPLYGSILSVLMDSRAADPGYLRQLVQFAAEQQQASIRAPASKETPQRVLLVSQLIAAVHAAWVAEPGLTVLAARDTLHLLVVVLARVGFGSEGEYDTNTVALAREVLEVITTGGEVDEVWESMGGGQEA